MTQPLVLEMHMWKLPAFAVVLSITAVPSASHAAAQDDAFVESARFQRVCKTVMVPRKRCVERSPGTYCSKVIVVMEPSTACGYSR